MTNVFKILSFLSLVFTVYYLGVFSMMFFSIIALKLLVIFFVGIFCGFSFHIIINNILELYIDLENTEIQENDTLTIKLIKCVGNIEEGDSLEAESMKTMAEIVVCAVAFVPLGIYILIKKNNNYEF